VTAWQRRQDLSFLDRRTCNCRRTAHMTWKFQTCRNQARVYGSPMFDVALARHSLQAPWLTNPDSEVRSHLEYAACLP
jgi:hypothetical protein